MYNTYFFGHSVLICDVASERRHKSGEVTIEFLVLSYYLDYNKAMVKIWFKNV